MKHTGTGTKKDGGVRTIRWLVGFFAAMGFGFVLAPPVALAEAGVVLLDVRSSDRASTDAGSDDGASGGGEEAGTGEVYYAYFSEVPGKSHWYLLTNAPETEDGELLVGQLKEKLTAGGAPDSWRVRRVANETMVNNQMRTFELIKAVIREYQKLSEAGWEEKLEQVVALDLGIKTGFLKAGVAMVKTLMELGYETNGLRFLLKAQTSAVRTSLGWIGCEGVAKYVANDPDDVINAVLKPLGYKYEDKLTIENATLAWQSLKSLCSDVIHDPIGTSVNQQMVAPLLKIVNAGDRREQGEEIGAIGFDTAMTVLTIIDLGTTAPALVGKVVQGLTQLSQMLMTGVGMVVRLGRASWAVIKTAPLRFMRSLKAVRALTGTTVAKVASCLKGMVSGRAGLVAVRMERETSEVAGRLTGGLKGPGLGPKTPEFVDMAPSRGTFKPENPEAPKTHRNPLKTTDSTVTPGSKDAGAIDLRKLKAYEDASAVAPWTEARNQEVQNAVKFVKKVKAQVRAQIRQEIPAPRTTPQTTAGGGGPYEYRIGEKFYLK